jgi:hypothetical protein
MAEGERRRPRESYTRALIRICEKFDSQDTYELNWKNRFLRRSCRGVLRADSLWVVGSYARGAATCGDLDLVLKVTHLEGNAASAAQFISKALPRSPGVRCYGGDPDENTSGVHFSEAVHIWSKGVDWRRAIESIPADPSAGRFTRPIDDIPLRLEQLCDDFGHVEVLLRRRKEEEISWRFIPIDPSETSTVDATEDWQHELARHMSFAGKQTQKLLPHLLRYFRDGCGPTRSRLHYETTSTELQFEGTFVTMGRPWLAHTRLDSPDVSRVLLIPHLSRRGPNGIWELSRGIAHPLEIRVRGLGAYVLKTPTGALSRECYSHRLGFDCEVIGLFPSVTRAIKYMKEQLIEDSGLTPTWLQGSALLETLSFTDVADVCSENGHSQTLVLTHAGRVVFSEDNQAAHVATSEQVVSALVGAYGGD